MSSRPVAQSFGSPCSARSRLSNATTRTAVAADVDVFTEIVLDAGPDEVVDGVVVAALDTCNPRSGIAAFAEHLQASEHLIRAGLVGCGVHEFTVVWAQPILDTGKPACVHPAPRRASQT